MKRIVILGAGESGAGAAVLAKKQGLDTFVTDMGSIKPEYKELMDQYGISWEEGKHTEELVLTADEVIKSPGIPDHAPMVKKIKEKGIPVISEIEFAGRYTDAKMVCITGSNGKTTTTSLIYHIFKQAGLNVGLAGNIGKSLALQVALENHDYYVIELSSFQLDNMYDFRAHIAILMNITPDHLDRYGNEMQNYVDAKFRILQNQTEDDAFVFWNDDPIIRRELKRYGIHARLYPFAQAKEEGLVAYTEEEKVYFTQPMAFNMEQEELALTGVHNLYNSMAAGISANLAGIRKEDIRHALGTFQGVEHRLEHVCRVRGVEYINDSKATNVNSCWYALQSMTTPTVLILGGKDKGNDYSEIKELVSQKCKGLIYMGLHNEKLHDFFDGMGLPVADVQSMKDAVAAAYRMTEPGDTVLLSPCCASFDLFTSYEDRGRQFKECVRNL
ncbi:MAG: UDP-N-acetylmuramoyl-L-alanine--D-glutamate ligase [Bacteroidaceae bacterium]|nr:UDP-N-acetylmuramoyl-L-alanine--D-glutamate ligase [Bacteroidaceae bacterium]